MLTDENPTSFPNSFRLVLRQTNKRWSREKVTTPGSQNLACLVRLYSGGQWTTAESKFESSLCIEINRRFPLPVWYFIHKLYHHTFTQLSIWSFHWTWAVSLLSVKLPIQQVMVCLMRHDMQGPKLLLRVVSCYRFLNLYAKS